MNDDRQAGRKEIGGGGEWTALRGVAERLIEMDAILADGQALVEWDELVAQARKALETPASDSCLGRISAKEKEWMQVCAKIMAGKGAAKPDAEDLSYADALRHCAADVRGILEALAAAAPAPPADSWLPQIPADLLARYDEAVDKAHSVGALKQLKNAEAAIGRWAIDKAIKLEHGAPPPQDGQGAELLGPPRGGSSSDLAEPNNEGVGSFLHSTEAEEGFRRALASPVEVWYPCGATASEGAPLRDCPIHGRECAKMCSIARQAREYYKTLLNNANMCAAAWLIHEAPIVTGAPSKAEREVASACESMFRADHGDILHCVRLKDHLLPHENGSWEWWDEAAVPTPSMPEAVAGNASAPVGEKRQPSGVGEPREPLTVKTCPFCDEVPVLTHHRGVWREHFRYNCQTPMCICCAGHCQVPTWPSQEEALAAWNKRVAAHEVGEGLREALERIAEISHHNLSDKQKCIHCIAKKALQDARYALAAPAPKPALPALTVTLCDYGELPDWVDRNSVSGNGSGANYANYLLIEQGDYRACYSDAMEPEDCLFSRDLKWIAVELRRAAERKPPET